MKKRTILSHVFGAVAAGSVLLLTVMLGLAVLIVRDVAHAVAVTVKVTRSLHQLHH